MRHIYLLTLLYLFLFIRQSSFCQSNAAPSEHLTYSFPNDAVLKMHKVKIVQSAFASYFEVQSFTNGYAGLQQTPDSSHGSSHILISSLWDPNTSGGIFSVLDYAAPNTYTGRFGGEGDGWQSINPYNWVLNTWYNLVIRSWKSKGQLFVATFINNLSSQTWFHTATFSIPDPGSYLGSGNDAFLENWDGSNAAWDGRYIRKAYFKDCWNLNTGGTWDKSTSRYFSANANDSARNGIYNNAFNSGYDSSQDAYFMQHGGNTTPAAGFNGGRTLTLPVQLNQGTAPTVTTGQVNTVSASYAGGKLYASWTIDSTKSPQLAASVQVTNPAGTVVLSYKDTLPQRRKDTLTGSLSPGTYTVKVSFTDLFNQTSNTATTPLTVAGSYTYWYSFKNVYSSKYLAVKDSSTADLANIVQYTTNNHASQWGLKSVNGATVLINRKSGKAIDLPGSSQTLGTDPIQYTETDNPNQQWNLVSVGSGKYLIQSNLSNHYVLDDSASSTVNGTNIILYSANGSSGGPNQQWLQQVADSSVSGASVGAQELNGTALMPAINASSFTLFPNPVSQTLHVVLPVMTSGHQVLQIYTLGGSRVFQSVVTNSSMDIDVSSLARGVYLVKVDGVSREFVKK
ncbi:MAG TPA: RICIN domain-containing protein [Puia sp.]|nr:RICIN domain-containing protein [Puia sp.]